MIKYILFSLIKKTTSKKKSTEIHSRGPTLQGRTPNVARSLLCALQVVSTRIMPRHSWGASRAEISSLWAVYQSWSVLEHPEERGFPGLQLWTDVLESIQSPSQLFPESPHLFEIICVWQCKYAPGVTKGLTKMLNFKESVRGGGFEGRGAETQHSRNPCTSRAPSGSSQLSTSRQKRTACQDATFVLLLH